MIVYKITNKINGKIYPSAAQAAKELNLCVTAIYFVLKGKRNHTGGLTFKYLDVKYGT